MDGAHTWGKEQGCHDSSVDVVKHIEQSQDLLLGCKSGTQEAGWVMWRRVQLGRKSVQDEQQVDGANDLSRQPCISSW